MLLALGLNEHHGTVWRSQCLLHWYAEDGLLDLFSLELMETFPWTLTIWRLETREFELATAASTLGGGIVELASDSKYPFRRSTLSQSAKTAFRCLQCEGKSLPITSTSSSVLGCSD